MPRTLNILLMGEESQEITKAFRAKGHNAFSCDFQPCSGGHPEWHIQHDMFEVFYGRYVDASRIIPNVWDRVIAHPTCTYMCNSGALRLYVGGKKGNGIDPVRWAYMQKSAEQFKQILSLPCKEIVVENPVMHKHAMKIISTRHTQTIQPYEYGHPESKRTCLWIKGLPPLKPTNILQKPECGHWEDQTPSGQNKLGPSADRGKKRAKSGQKLTLGGPQLWQTNGFN